MIYYVYKITLLKGSLAGAYYIGQHRTKKMNDGYAGSGTILRNYYKVYGEKNGETYTKEIIRYCSSIEELNNAEEELVADLYSSDPNCINLIAGGRGKGYSEETRRKISEANKGREISAELRKRISDTLKGHPVPDETRKLISERVREKCKSPEHRKKISEAQKHRKPMSDETRKKISEAGRGRPCYWSGKKMPNYITEKMSASQIGFRYIHKLDELKRVKSPELEEYLSNGWVLGMRESDIKKSADKRRGRHLSEETKRKLSKVNKGRKMSEEARAKIAANNRAKANDPEIRKKISMAKKGKPCSPEHIAKIAEARRGMRWYYDENLKKRVYYAVLQRN